MAWPIGGVPASNLCGMSAQVARSSVTVRIIGISDAPIAEWSDALIVPQGDYLVIKTGEAHTVTRQGQGIGFSSFGATGAIISGVRMMFSVEVYASKTGQSETYITTLLKKRDLELVPQTSIVTKYDKIDRLADRLKDIQAAGTAFDFNNNTYFFYWHKKLKKMMIEWVDDPASP